MKADNCLDLQAHKHVWNAPLSQCWPFAIRPMGTNSSKVWIKSFILKIYLKFAKFGPYSPGANMLKCFSHRLVSGYKKMFLFLWNAKVACIVGFDKCVFWIYSLILLNLCGIKSVGLCKRHYCDITKCHAVSNHWQLDCLFSSLFRLRTEKTSELCFTGHLWGESTGDSMHKGPVICHDIIIDTRAHLLLHPGGWFNKKMSSYQYRKSLCGDKMILRPSYLHNGISYTGKMTSLYWIRALELHVFCTNLL